MSRRVRWIESTVMCALISLGSGCGSAKERAPESGTPDQTKSPEPTTDPASGKDPGADPSGKKASTMSRFEDVQQWARPGSVISIFEDVKVPQMELFSVAWRDPRIASGPSERRGVAVVENATKWIEGKAALREVMARGIVDAEPLARLSLHFLHDSGALEAAMAGSSAPVKEQGALTYYWRRGDSGRGLMRSSLDLKTLELSTGPAVRADPVAIAAQALGSQGDIAAQGAITELSSQHCADPRTVPLLLKTATSHGNAGVRAAAATALGTCKAAQAATPLVKLLETDPDQGVRMGAAAGLGEIGGAQVEAALRAASAKESNGDVKRAISRAIKRILASK